jgi:Flp pilus assembly protein TadD
MGGQRGPTTDSIRPPLMAGEGRKTDALSSCVIDAPSRDLLCALAYVYLACGQNLRALALLRLAEREKPDDIGLLRVLAYALVAIGDGHAALRVIARLEALDTGSENASPLLLLRSHALRLAGRLDDARRCFRAFMTARNEGRGSPCSV